MTHRGNGSKSSTFDSYRLKYKELQAPKGDSQGTAGWASCWGSRRWGSRTCATLCCTIFRRLASRASLLRRRCPSSIIFSKFPVVAGNSRKSSALRVVRRDPSPLQLTDPIRREQALRLELTAPETVHWVARAKKDELFLHPDRIATLEHL